MENNDKRKILLIDDDTNLLVTLSDFLRFEGYTVATADSGEHGLKMLQKMTPDLIILDMSMPGMGGVGFLKAISTPEGKPNHPVLVLTARSNMAEFFANVEVEGFVAKPCDPADLIMEVGRIIFLRSGAAQKASATAASLQKKKKALVAEDEMFKNQLITTALADAGYLVDGVESGPEVLEKAIVQRPDVIIMKVILRQMNGDAVADMLKEMPNTKHIPVILYDDSTTPNVSVEKYQDGRGNVKKLLRSSNSQNILAAVADVLA